MYLLSEFVYLSRTLTTKNNIEKMIIKKEINLVTTAYFPLLLKIKSKTITTNITNKIDKTVIRNTLTYGAKIWSFNKTMRIK